MKKVKVYGWGVYFTDINKLLHIRTEKDFEEPFPNNQKEYLRVNYSYTWRYRRIVKVLITEVKEKRK